MEDLLASTPPAPWNAPVAKHRRWVSAEVALDDVRAVRQRTDATVNDVVLALCTGALRDYLRRRRRRRGGAHAQGDGAGLAAPPRRARRGAGEQGVARHGRPARSVRPTPRRACARSTQQTVELKASARAEGVETLLSAAGEFPVLAAPLARLVSHSVPMNLVITNIPGPRCPCSCEAPRFGGPTRTSR